MRIPKTFGLLALSLAISLAACKANDLPPMPGPGPALLEKVPVLIRIPINMTEPCPKVGGGKLETDVDLAIKGDRAQVRADCNAGKLKAIEQAMEKAPAQ